MQLVAPSVVTVSTVTAAHCSLLDYLCLGKMRIHVTAFQDTEIIVSKDKVASVKRWLDS